jgi:hypothetical protein
MKKMILALMAAGLAISQVQTAKAGGVGIAAAAVGGVAVGTVIGEAISRPVYYAPAPVYYYPAAPVACQAVAPAPAVVYAQPTYVCAPAPVVRIGVGFAPWRAGWYDRPYWHRRW